MGGIRPLGSAQRNLNKSLLAAGQSASTSYAISKSPSPSSSLDAGHPHELVYPTPTKSVLTQNELDVLSSSQNRSMDRLACGDGNQYLVKLERNSCGESSGVDNTGHNSTSSSDDSPRVKCESDGIGRGSDLITSSSHRLKNDVKLCHSVLTFSPNPNLPSTAGTSSLGAGGSGMGGVTTGGVGLSRRDTFSDFYGQNWTPGENGMFFYPYFIHIFFL